MVLESNEPSWPIASSDELGRDALYPRSESSLLAERLKALTFKQIHSIDLLSQGHKKPEIARILETSLPEVKDVISGVLGTLNVTQPGAVYILLKEGLIQISDEEKQQAQEKVGQLGSRPKEVLQTFMAGRTKKQAEDELHIAKGTVNKYLNTTYKTLGVHSIEEAVRVGFAGGLRAKESEGKFGEESPVSRKNAVDFLVWMYPGVSRDTLEKITDSELSAIAEILSQEANRRKAKSDRSTARKLEVPIRVMQKWFEGKSVAEIAEAEGRMEGSILIGLSGFGAKLVSPGGFEELREAARARVLEKRTRETASAGRLVTGEIVELGEVTGGKGLGEETEETVKEVIISLREQISGERALALSQDYLRPIKVTADFEPEVVTLLNMRRGRMHIDDIINAIFGHQVSSEEQDTVQKALADIITAGFIVAEGDGYYSTWGEMPEEEPEPEPLIILEPQAGVEPSKPIVDARSYPGDFFSTRRGRSEDKERILEEMMREAGVTVSGHRSMKRGGGNNKGRR